MWLVGYVSSRFFYQSLVPPQEEFLMTCRAQTSMRSADVTQEPISDSTVLFIQIGVGRHRRYEGFVRLGHPDEREDVVKILQLVTRAFPPETSDVRQQTAAELGQMYPDAWDALLTEVRNAEVSNPPAIAEVPAQHVDVLDRWPAIPVGPAQHVDVLDRMPTIRGEQLELPSYHQADDNATEELVAMAKRGDREGFFALASCLMPVSDVGKCWSGTRLRLGLSVENPPPAAPPPTVWCRGCLGSPDECHVPECVEARAALAAWAEAMTAP